jgi:hypothetical protein
LTQRELKDLQLKNSSAVAAGADRAGQKAGHVTKSRSMPSVRSSNETPRL